MGHCSVLFKKYSGDTNSFHVLRNVSTDAVATAGFNRGNTTRKNSLMGPHPSIKIDRNLGDKSVYQECHERKLHRGIQKYDTNGGIIQMQKLQYFGQRNVIDRKCYPKYQKHIQEIVKARLVS